MRIDIHSHFIPEAFIHKVKKDPVRFRIQVENRGGREFFVHQEGFAYPLFDTFYNDRKKISIHFLHGGNLKKMTGKIMSPFVGLSVLGTIPVLLFSFWQRKTLYMTINNTSLLMFLATHVLITSLMYFLAFYSVFTMIRKSERGDSYVR